MLQIVSFPSLFRLVFFVVLLFSLSHSSVSFSNPTLQDGTYEIREGILLSQQWKIAAINFDIQEEPYFPITVPCFTCFNYPSKNDTVEEPCVCDFSRYGIYCGSVPEGCPKETCSEEDVDKYCTQAGQKNSWNTIELSQKQSRGIHKIERLFLKKDERLYFRLHLKHACQGFKTKVLYEYGVVDIFMSNNEPEPTEITQDWTTNARQYIDATELDMCAEFLGSKLGTYYITLIGRANDSLFDLMTFFDEATIDRPINGAEVDTCRDLPTHKCVPMGIPYELTDTTRQTAYPVRLEFPVRRGECITLTVFLQADQGDGGLCGSFTDIFPNVLTGNPDYQSELAGSDYIFVQRCYDEDGIGVFYATIFAWAGAPYYSLRWTLNNTPFLLRSSELSPYQYGYSAVRTLIGRCPTSTSPALTWMCQDWRSYCASFWLVYPSEDPNPFWPPPAQWSATSSPASAALFKQITKYDVPVRNASINSLSLIVVLSNTLFGKETHYLSEIQLRDCVFESVGRTLTKNRRAVLGKAKVKPRMNECTQSLVQPIIDLGRSLSAQLTDSRSFSESIKLSFEIDTLKFTSGWMSCNLKADKMLIRNMTKERVPTTACFVDNSSSSAYKNDPCCNGALATKQCCLPREKTIDAVTSFGLNTEAISTECENSECVKSYMAEWQFLKRSNLRCSSFSSDEYPKILRSGTEFYTNCKKKYNLDNLTLSKIRCTSDAQCHFGGLQNQCNLVTLTCFLARETEEATVRCIVEGMDLYTEHYVKGALGIPGRKNSEEFFFALLDALKSFDCRNDNGHSVSLYSSHQFRVTEKSCAKARDCEEPLSSCLDPSCTIEPSICLTTCQPNWIPIPSERIACESMKKCNWITNECDDFKDSCEDQCHSNEADDYFCSYCFNDLHCVEIPGVKTQKGCEDLEACYFPDGSIDIISNEVCKKVGSCSEPCHGGKSCESSNQADNICIKPGASQRECRGDWRSDLGACVLPRLGQILCGETGGLWLTCKGLSLAECDSCYLGGECAVNQTLLNCQIVPRVPCTNRRQCESSGGWCSDGDYYNTFFGVSTDDFGACLFDAVTASFGGVFPVCFFGDMSPQGCATAATFTECKLSGGSWHVMASSKEECEEGTGCSIYSQVDAYAPMTNRNCTKCGMENSSYYRWRGGKWVGAKPIRSSWRKRKVFRLYDWKPAVNFDKFYTLLRKAVEESIFSDLRSQTFCDFSAQSNILEVVSCSCGNIRESGNCFSVDSREVVVGTGLVCIGLGSSVQTAFSSVSTSPDAVEIGSEERCVALTLSFCTIYVLEKSEQQPFSPTLRTREFDSLNVVRNEDFAIVGRLMSNGAVVELSATLKSYEICLVRSDEAITGKPPETFNTWDVGVVITIHDEEFLKPLALDVKSKRGDTFCFEIKNPKKKDVYFLIVRQERYEDTSGSLYGSESAAWWTFAALYTCLALFAAGTACLKFFGFKLHFYLFGLFSFLTAMCVVRSVYFYLLGAGVFDDQSFLAIAYFLVELPTLLYFTAFSCLAAFWMFVINMNSQANHRTVILACTISGNLLLYTIFAIFLILYQTLPTTVESACFNRIPDEEDNSNQKVVAIIYQSFMAGVSLVIAVFVFIFGGKLFLGLKKRSFEGKIAIVTLVCCFGLLLHCAFILFLSVTLGSYNFTIIVMMVVLSELLPIFVVTVQFSVLRHPSKRILSENRTLRFIKTILSQGGASLSHSQPQSDHGANSSHH